MLISWAIDQPYDTAKMNKNEVLLQDRSFVFIITESTIYFMLGKYSRYSLNLLNHIVHKGKTNYRSTVKHKREFGKHPMYIPFLMVNNGIMIGKII